MSCYFLIDLIAVYFQIGLVPYLEGELRLKIVAMRFYLAGNSDTFNHFSIRKRQLLAGHGRYRIANGPEGPMKHLGIL